MPPRDVGWPNFQPHQSPPSERQHQWVGSVWGKGASASCLAKMLRHPGGRSASVPCRPRCEHHHRQRMTCFVVAPGSAGVGPVAIAGPVGVVLPGAEACRYVHLQLVVPGSTPTARHPKKLVLSAPSMHLSTTCSSLLGRRLRCVTWGPWLHLWYGGRVCHGKTEKGNADCSERPGK